jgi:methylenetetrahydrofolate dehydrogenase (NADP+)/methenyltetrahydrofolate cyclohydrolase
MNKVIDGKKIAEKIKNEIVKEIKKMNFDSDCPKVRPNLAIILVGEREDSKLYVSLKEREAKKVGIDTHLYRCPENMSEQEIIETIDYLNKDDIIDAILIQLPLPQGFNTDKIILKIDPAKDVDRFHPKNLEEFSKTCGHHHVMPPLIASILKILENIKYEISGKNVCIISNSKTFGNTCAQAFKCQKAKAITTNIKDELMIKKTSKADILISVVGQPKFIKKEMIKRGAVIIDIGITKKDGHVYGDVDFEDLKEKAGFITPVPGGVGPITIAMLFRNTLELFKDRQKNK